MHTDTPLAGHPTLTLAVFGLGTFAALTYWLPLTAWAVLRDRGGQGAWGWIRSAR